jgi:hypothetical protein
VTKPVPLSEARERHYQATIAALLSHLDGGRVERKLDRILIQLAALQAQGVTEMATIADVKAQADKALLAIADESSKDDSIIALVQANTAQISLLRQQLADALAGGADPAALQAVLDSLIAAETNALANSTKVVDAVNANTPTP